MSDDLVGRTIVSVEDRDYEGARIHFADGTYADVMGGGYEDSSAVIEWVSPEEHARRVEEARLAEEDRISRSFCPQRNPPRTTAGMDGILKELYAQPILDQMRRDFNRQLFPEDKS